MKRIQTAGIFDAKKLQVKLFIATAAVALCVAPFGAISTASANPLPKPMAWMQAGGQVNYVLAPGDAPSIMPVASPQDTVQQIMLGADGCVLYLTSDGDLYEKSALSASDNTLIVSASTTIFGDYRMNDHCAIAYVSVDDSTGFANTVWYKQTPASTPVEVDLGPDNDNTIVQLALDNNGGIAWIDIDQNLYYKSSLTATPVMIAPPNGAIYMRMNGQGNIVFQDPDQTVFFRESPTSPIVQYSDPGIAAMATISIANNGAVAWTCNTAAMYYRESVNSLTEKISADHFMTRSYISSDGSGFMYEYENAGLAYMSVQDRTSVDVAPQNTFATYFEIY